MMISRPRLRLTLKQYKSCFTPDIHSLKGTYVWLRVITVNSKGGHKTEYATRRTIY